jgi:hypothetical protein
LSLEFAVEYECALRARYGEEHLRAWGRLGSLHARLTTGEQLAPSLEKLRFIEQAREEIELLHAETQLCARCPARLPIEAAGDGEAVRCLGRISYPIDGQFEKFLADRAQLAFDTISIDEQPRLLSILVDRDSPFDGEGAKSLRAVTLNDGLRFLELRLPIKLAGVAAHLTTDHLFDALAGFASADDAKTSYAREFPHTAASDYRDFLELILRHDLTASEIARLNARSRSYKQYLRLLAAFERAEAFGGRVLID